MTLSYSCMPKGLWLGLKRRKELIGHRSTDTLLILTHVRRVSILGVVFPPRTFAGLFLIRRWAVVTVYLTNHWSSADWKAIIDHQRTATRYQFPDVEWQLVIIELAFHRQRDKAFLIVIWGCSCINAIGWKNCTALTKIICTYIFGIVMPLFNKKKETSDTSNKTLSGLQRYDIKKDHVLGT